MEKSLNKSIAKYLNKTPRTRFFLRFISHFPPLRTLVLLLALFLGYICPLRAADKPLVTIQQFVSHPALDAAKKGIQQALQERELQAQIETKEDNAQGNVTLAIQIAKHHAALNPAIMVAIATPSAQVILKAKQTSTLLAFVAVSDPISAGLNGSNIIGVTDQPPVEELFSLVTQILPSIKTVGVLYTPAEINSVKTVERLAKELERKDLRLKKMAVNSSADIKSATLGLMTEVDIIYIPQDNLVVSAIETVISTAKQKKIPVIGNDPSLVDQGLLMALGSDYFNSGLQLGNMIADKLENKNPIPLIQHAKAKELKLNKGIAQSFNITFPIHLSTKETP